MKDTTNQDRHRQFVNSLSKALNRAKEELNSIRNQLWKHSSDYALLSRMADQESAAKTAAEAHGQLLPQYREALSRVAEKAQILSGECIDFAQKWGTHEAWMIPELLHEDGHTFHTWRIPACVLCQAGYK